MTTAIAEVLPALARYAERFHAAIGDSHHVASPLGAWLLLELCLSAAGEKRENDRIPNELTSVSHDLVLLAAAAWTGATAPPATAARLARDLPAAVATGPLPDQSALDAWAAEKTLGLIDRFPVTVSPETLLVLATALATKVSWAEPFVAVPASQLRSGWTQGIETVLRQPRGHAHRSFLARTARAGEVAVHSAAAYDQNSGDGLHVTSVIAAPEVPARDVLAAAYELAPALATWRGRPGEVSLFDLPLGDGPLWTISESTTFTTAPNGREERCEAVLPAWEAKNDHDLGHPDLGFPAAARALAEMLSLPEYAFEARQSAVASYTRTGFEAAAVTAMAVAAGYVEPREGLLREAELRFGHPYAVVATTSQHDKAWDGVPVFSAWVTEPSNA